MRVDKHVNHGAGNREKMRRGIALTDADRGQWLDILAGVLAAQPQGVVLTCSALKRAYRERLRAAAPQLRFVFMELTQDEAQRRVQARAADHFFPPGLVASQFATLESPVGEAGVLRLDATRPLDELRDAVTGWLARGRTA